MVEFSIDDFGPSLQTPIPKTLIMPMSQSDWYNAVQPKGRIDFQKYENWLRCMNLTRVARLLDLFGLQWDEFYVRFNNQADPDIKLMTTVSAMAHHPSFLSQRPRNIWCSFTGGPYNTLSVQSSLLNYVIDRVYQNIIKEGVAATDAQIIAALNFKPTLLLTGPT